jgi:hypothetical protein
LGGDEGEGGRLDALIAVLLIEAIRLALILHAVLLGGAFSMGVRFF